jgi:hypothetical protein
LTPPTICAQPALTALAIQQFKVLLRILHPLIHHPISFETMLLLLPLLLPLQLG